MLRLWIVLILCIVLVFVTFPGRTEPRDRVNSLYFPCQDTSLPCSSRLAWETCHRVDSRHNLATVGWDWSLPGCAAWCDRRIACCNQGVRRLGKAIGGWDSYACPGNFEDVLLLSLVIDSRYNTCHWKTRSTSIPGYTVSLGLFIAMLLLAPSLYVPITLTWAQVYMYWWLLGEDAMWGNQFLVTWDYSNLDT